MNNVKFLSIDNIKIDDEEKTHIVYDIETENHFLSINGIYTHNCRLKNEVEENDFSYSLGGGGVQTGSTSVMTLNLNRIIQETVKDLIKEKNN